MARHGDVVCNQSLVSTQQLAAVCAERGLRALVGRVAMDEPNLCPEYYRDSSAQAALEADLAFLESQRSRRSLLSNGCCRPDTALRAQLYRELLRGMGDLASRYGCHVQTHCSESDWEHQFVIDRFGREDALVLDEFGLLGQRTVLAHGVSSVRRHSS